MNQTRRLSTGEYGAFHYYIAKTLILFFCLFAIVTICLPSNSMALPAGRVPFGGTSQFYCTTEYLSQDTYVCLWPAGCYSYPANYIVYAICSAHTSPNGTRPLIGVNIEAVTWQGWPADVVTDYYGPLTPLTIPECDWGDTTEISCTNSYAAQEIIQPIPNYSDMDVPEGYLLSAGCGSDYQKRFPGMVAVGCISGAGDWNGWPTNLHTYYYVPCENVITNYTSTNGGKIIPETGGTITISGNFICASTQQPIKMRWKVEINGKTIASGYGSSFSATWDGKKGDGTVAKAGETAMATISTLGTSDATNVPITVAPPPQWSGDSPANSIPINIGSDGPPSTSTPGGDSPTACLSSTSNVASGNFSHYQDLFILPNAKFVGAFTLTYNSIDDYKAILGRGWTHSFNMRLVQNSGNSFTLVGGGGQTTVLYQNGNIYTPENFSYPALTVNSDNSYTVAYKDGRTYSFGQNGKITAIRDRNSNTENFVYDAQGNLTNIIDPSGRTITLTNDTAGRILTVADPMGNNHSFTYDGDMLVQVSTTTTANATSSWNYTYDANGFMLTRTDPMGYVSSYTYDSAHRVTSAIDPEGKIRSNSYPAIGPDVIKTTDFIEKDGGVWTYKYDTNYGYVIEKTDPQGAVTSFTHDPSGNILTKTKPGGATASYTYDSSNNITSITDPLGNITSYSFNNFGQVTSVTDARNNITTYIYDDKGNLITTSYPGGATVQFQYDSKGNVISKTDARNQTTTFGYDQANNLISITDPLGVVTAFAYSAAGNMTQQIDAEGGMTNFEYDSRNRMTAMIDPLNYVTTYTYDANGNRTSVTDADNNTTTYEYNYRGQVTKITDAAGKITTFTYGSTGCPSCGGGVDKLTSITDAKGNVTAFEYDTLGRLVKETDPLGYITTFLYDSSGNLLSKTDANGNTMTYSYDVDNRLTQKTFPDGSITSFQYDAKGNMTYAGNQNIAYTFTYDLRDRVTSVIDSNNRTIQYAYDNNSNRLTMADPLSRTIQYAYNPINLLSSIQNDTDTLSFSYDSMRRRKELSYPNGLKKMYSYDSASRLTGLALQNQSDMTLTATSYGYDKYGNRTSIINIPSTEDMPMKPIEDYVNGLGNRLLEDGSYMYGYDNNGNLVTKTKKTTGEVTTFYWDAENKLIKATMPNGVMAQYKYDPFGRRIEKNVNGTVTKQFYDKQNALFEYDQNGNVVRSYINGLRIDEPLILNSNGSTYFYHANGLGSIETLTDRYGTVVQRNVYDDFGTVRNRYINGNAPNQPYAFTAKEYDEETGLYYYSARYYDPISGRFISRDPIGFAGGDINLYNYVGANPVNRTDPLGLSDGKDCSYYQKVCKDSPTLYYCGTVQFACNNWPDTKVDDFLDKPGWSDCVRSCLQDFDNRFNCSAIQKCERGLPFGEVIVQTGLEPCAVGAHSYCFTKCYLK